MKNISITINNTDEIPPYICNFTNEENYLMLLIGSQFVIKGTQGVSDVIMKEVLQEKQKQVNDLINELEYQKRYYKDFVENSQQQKIRELNDIMCLKLENKDLIIADLQKQIEMFSNLLEKKNMEFISFKEKNETEFINKLQMLESKEIKDKEFLDKERERNEKTFDKLQETLKITNAKTGVELGIQGELTFQILAEKAFRDFENFYLKDVSKETSKGDYHLFFKDFSVLVDTKNYIKTNVNNTSKKKFKYDIENNKHMNIAWLISLHGTINSYNKFPIMFEFVENQCIFYINNLLKYEEPIEMLRLIWSVSQNINFVLTRKDANIDNYQIYEKKVLEIVKELDKINREENALISEISKNLDKIKNSKKTTKDFLNDLLNKNLNEEISEEYENIIQENIVEVLKKWCDNKLEFVTNMDSKLKYSEIYDELNKDITMKRYNVKKTKLKEYISNIYNHNIKDSKSNEIKGIQWKI